MTLELWQGKTNRARLVIWTKVPGLISQVQRKKTYVLFLILATIFPAILKVRIAGGSYEDG